MKRVIALFSVAVFSLAFLAACSQNMRAGGLIGGFSGAVLGAAVTPRNPLQGAIIGAIIGASVGTAAGSIADQAARDAARENRPVRYEERKGGKVMVAEATPIGPGSRPNCKQIHN
jgi:hypothetical protein